MIRTPERLDLKPLSDLTPFEGNPRTHSKAQVEQIVESIKQFGFTAPILVDDTGTIVAGHGRLEAAKQLKMDQVPVVSVGRLTDAQRKAYVVADNQLTITADWDLDRLKDITEDLLREDFPLSVMGFEPTFIDSLIATDVDDESATGDSQYTGKVNIPTYEPTGPKPEVTQLYEFDRVRELLDEINASDCSDAEKHFLRAAAYRHTRIDFREVANYYAHSDKPIQQLFESNALVLVDLDYAITKGWAKLSNELDNLYSQRTSEDEK